MCSEDWRGLFEGHGGEILGPTFFCGALHADAFGRGGEVRRTDELEAT
jgi:hypothetical protein